MTANRQFPTAGSGPAYMAKIAEEGGALYNAAALPLTNVAGGTDAHAKTACSPPLLAGLLNGMSFWWTAAFDSPGAMDMVVDGNAAVAMVTDAGLPIGLSVIKAGQTYKLVVWAGVIVVMGTAGVAKVNFFQKFIASGTLILPAGPANALVTFEAWSAGGGGGSGTSGAVSGAGGGGMFRAVFKLGDLPSSIAITIAAGGSIGLAGGNTVVGSLFTVYGGGAGARETGGSNRSASGGSGGGGAVGASGITGNASSSANTTSSGATPPDPTAGQGGTGSVTGAANTTSSTKGSLGHFGGGGGGGCGNNGSGTTSGSDGGNAVFGGGGGAGRGGTSGGVSQFGGNGGAPGAVGQAPGGGGGANAAGGRGEVRVYING